MIIDKTKIITGSFNFTKAAQKYNLENVLIIEDAGLAEKYREEWLKQFQNSKAM
jgi:phospholipase D